MATADLGIVSPCYRGVYDGSTAYNRLNIVDDGAGTVYMAIQSVPAGIALTNTDYWLCISSNAAQTSASYEIGKTYRYVGVIGAGSTGGSAGYSYGWIEYTRLGVYTKGGHTYGRGVMSFTVHSPYSLSDDYSIVNIPNTSTSFTFVGGSDTKTFTFVLPDSQSYNTGIWGTVTGTSYGIETPERGVTCHIQQAESESNLSIQLGRYYLNGMVTDFGAWSQKNVFGKNNVETAAAVYGTNIYIEEQISV